MNNCVENQSLLLKLYFFFNMVFNSWVFYGTRVIVTVMRCSVSTGLFLKKIWCYSIQIYIIWNIQIYFIFRKLVIMFVGSANFLIIVKLKYYGRSVFSLINYINNYWVSQLKLSNFTVIFIYLQSFSAQNFLSYNVMV